MRIATHRAQTYRTATAQPQTATPREAKRPTPAVFEPWVGKSSFEPMSKPPVQSPTPSVSTAQPDNSLSTLQNLLGMAAKIAMMFFNPFGAAGGFLMNLLGGLFSGKGDDNGIFGKLLGSLKGLLGGPGQ